MELTFINFFFHSNFYLLIIIYNFYKFGKIYLVQLERKKVIALHP